MLWLSYSIFGYAVSIRVSFRERSIIAPLPLSFYVRKRDFFYFTISLSSGLTFLKNSDKLIVEVGGAYFSPVLLLPEVCAEIPAFIFCILTARYSLFFSLLNSSNE